MASSAAKHQGCLRSSAPSRARWHLSGDFGRKKCRDPLTALLHGIGLWHGGHPDALCFPGRAFPENLRERDANLAYVGWPLAGMEGQQYRQLLVMACRVHPDVNIDPLFEKLNNVPTGEDPYYWALRNAAWV
jgi:hypothetical protein